MNATARKTRGKFSTINYKNDKLFLLCTLISRFCEPNAENNASCFKHLLQKSHKTK